MENRIDVLYGVDLSKGVRGWELGGAARVEGVWAITNNDANANRIIVRRTWRYPRDAASIRRASW